MMKVVFALGAAAVALTAVPADAQRSMNHAACAQSRHGQCVASQPMTRAQARRAGYRVGYAFGPNYSYSNIGALPRPMVTRYHLGPNFRYVNRNGYVYVVNPHTYRVVRVITAS